MGKKKNIPIYYLELKADGYERSPCTTTKPDQKRENHVELNESYLNSPAFHSLTGNQRALCIVYLSQWSTDPYKDNYLEQDNITEVIRRESFYLNWALGKRIGIYRSKTTFYKDLKRLEEVGFIDCLYHGHSKGDRSLYKWSERWKKFRLSNKEPPPSQKLDSAEEK